jgi:rhodanese-related sulfurtransferase
MIGSITPSEAAGREDLWILDVREPHEWDFVHLPESRHIPLRQLPALLDQLPKDRAIACLCHHGIRSRHAAELLHSAGFSEVCNIEGGIDRWAIEVDPALPRY